MASQSQTKSKTARGRGSKAKNGSTSRSKSRSTSQSKPRSKSQSKSSGRRASQKTDKYRFAQNGEGLGTVAEREYERYAVTDDADMGTDPDVLLDVPVIKVDRIHLELENLDAHVALKAKVLDLVNLNVGINAHLGKLRVDIEGVEAQALVKVRLDHVAAIVDRVLTTIDRNPELVESLGAAVEDVGSGAGHMLDESGDAVEDVGEGAGDAVGEIGEGAGQAVGEIGEGAGQAVGEVGEGAGQAVGDIGQGAGQAVEGVGEGAGQAAGNLDGLVGGVGDTVGQLGQGAGQAVGGIGEGAGQAAGGLGEAAGGLGGAVGQLGDQAGQLAGGVGGQGGSNGDGGSQGDGGAGGAAGELTAPKLAKEAAKHVVKEIGAAAADEARDLGLAATRKVMEMGERRREKRAEKHHATEAAMRTAQELGIDLESIDGSGAEGRITVNDVRKAATEEQ